MVEGAASVLVINPSSSIEMTAAISAGLDGFRVRAGFAIECIGIAEGPATIGTEADILRSGLQIGEAVARRAGTGPVVIACYAQPGLHHARSLTRDPVIGIQDAAVLSAMALVDRFGVIALSEASIARHMRHLRALGVAHRLAGETVLEREDGSDAALLAGLVAAGGRLAAIGAEAVILGCASFAAQRGPLERALGLPVIDPTQAGVAMALGHLCRST